MTDSHGPRLLSSSNPAYANRGPDVVGGDRTGHQWGITSVIKRNVLRSLKVVFVVTGLQAYRVAFTFTVV